MPHRVEPSAAHARRSSPPPAAAHPRRYNLVLRRGLCSELTALAAHDALNVIQGEKFVPVERFYGSAQEQSYVMIDGYTAITWLFGFFSLHSLLIFDPCSSFPGRPIPPTSSSSLLPSAQLPSSHNPPPVSCQMPLLDSNTSHQIMDTNPDEEFSPNSYLLRACSGPQQASSSGKKIANIRSLFVTCLCRFYAFFYECVLASPQN